MCFFFIMFDFDTNFCQKEIFKSEYFLVHVLRSTFKKANWNFLASLLPAEDSIFFYLSLIFATKEWSNRKKNRGNSSFNANWHFLGPLFSPEKAF